MDSEGGFCLMEQAALGMTQLPQFGPGSPTTQKSSHGSACILSLV